MKNAIRLLAISSTVAAVLAMPLPAFSADQQKSGEQAAQPQIPYGYGPGMMGGYGMGPGMMGGYGMGPGMMGGYGMGPGMMGGYGMGPGMMGGYGMGPGMMGGYGMGPGMMGGYGGRNLGLTDAQQTKLNKIMDETRKTHWAIMGAMMDQMSKLRDLYEAPKRNEAAVEEAYKQFGQLRQQMFDSAVDAHKRMEAVLTKEQRERLRNEGSWGMPGY